MKIFGRILNTLLLFAVANCYFALESTRQWIAIPVLVVVFVLINLFPSPAGHRVPTFRLRVCSDGAELLILFLTTSVLSSVYHLFLAFRLFPAQWKTWVFSALLAIGVEAILFWNGIIRVYAASLQLGIHRRVVGIVCGWIPVVNIVALCLILHTVSQEVSFETRKIAIDSQRAAAKICCTKYPLLLVHGVFFRDFRCFNYWGRIPKALKANGARIFYGNHQSAASVADSAQELTDRIKAIVEETGCEKVNIIAHSKGGLDCRYALSRLQAAPYVASLTTINTPHRGCLFAEYLLEKSPKGLLDAVARKYEAAMRKCGDLHPDFKAAVWDLTASACRERNAQCPDVPGVYYQSFGSRLNRPANAKFPLNFTHVLARYFDGPNDGLVAETSFPWGTDYTFLRTNGNRGISHGDMIDLNRENIPGFDVREFYVEVVSRLRMRGL